MSILRSNISSKLALGLTCSLMVTGFALAEPSIQGWNTTEENKGTFILTPKNLTSGKTFKVTVFPVTALKDQSLKSWMTLFIQKDSPKRGKVVSPMEDLQEEGPMVTGALGIEARGEQRVLMYVGFEASAGKGQILLMETSMDRELTSKYSPAFSQFIAETIQQTSNQTASGQSNNATSGLAGVKLGGALAYGTYQCSKPLSSGQTIKYTLSLYDNGEYRIGDDDTGKFEYNAQNGKIDINVMRDLYNSTYDDSVFSVYYRDKNNKPVIYGENDYGLDVWKTTCLYAGKNTSPSPSVQTKLEREKEAEERRFKWVTQPGKGVQMNQIEALVLHYELDYNVLSNMYQQMPKLALLLKDGTAYTGLRVPPEDLDLKASRKNEPKTWTQWKRSGKNYLLLQEGKWNNIGELGVLPASKNEKLTGDFKHMASSYQAGLGGTTWTTFFTFTPQGKFDILDTSLSSTGILQANNGFSASASSTSDASGTSSAASASSGNGMGEAPTVGVTSQNQSDKPNPEKTGTYTLNGYTLQLKLGNGKTERKLFFFFNKKKEDIWIGENLFYRPD